MSRTKKAARKKSNEKKPTKEKQSKYNENVLAFVKYRFPFPLCVLCMAIAAAAAVIVDDDDDDFFLLADVIVALLTVRVNVLSVL